MGKFWDFSMQASGAGALTLYGEISDTSWFGDEVTPAAFLKDLEALGEIGALDVYINSPGGDVFAGYAIYNILRRHPARVTVHVDGLAASAASVVAMAGDRIVMPAASMMMVHRAWTLACGDAARLLDIAAELERVDGQLAQIYADRTGKAIEDIKALMAAETWMTGAEALALGFCDEVEPNKRIAALCGPEALARYKHPPELPSDGGESQPVEDKDPKEGERLAAQKRRFAFRKKIVEEK